MDATTLGELLGTLETLKREHGADVPVIIQGKGLSEPIVVTVSSREYGDPLPVSKLRIVLDTE